MRTIFTVALLAALIQPSDAISQQARRDSADRGVYVTLFRSPATGLELRSGHFGGYAGFYPTVIARDGRRGNANFIRAGATYYVRERGATAYVSPSLMWSLDPHWKNGSLTEVGFRGRLFQRLNGRLGAATLMTFDGQVRVNPTVGLDIRVGGGR